MRISGNGQAELLALLSGESFSEQGEIWLKGQNITKLNAGERRDLGLGFVPEERLGRGAVPADDLSGKCFTHGISSWVYAF